MTTDKLFKAIERQTGITREQIMSKSRKEELVYARRIICYFLREEGASDKEIGCVLNRDRSTIQCYAQNHQQEYKYNAKFRAIFDSINNTINLI